MSAHDKVEARRRLAQAWAAGKLDEERARLEFEQARRAHEQSLEKLKDLQRDLFVAIEPSMRKVLFDVGEWYVLITTELQTDGKTRREVELIQTT